MFAAFFLATAQDHMVYSSCAAQRMFGVLFLLLQSAQLFYTFATYSHELCCRKRTLSSTLSTRLLAIHFYTLKENSCKLLGTFEKESIFFVKFLELSNVCIVL